MKKPGLRMHAYYYDFDETGVPEIDRILSAVACAGKSFHHTEEWPDEQERPAPEGHEGNSCIKWIQNAANAAAKADGPCVHDDTERFALGGFVAGCELVWCTRCGAQCVEAPGLAHDNPWTEPGQTVGKPVVWPFEHGGVWEWREALTAIAERWEAKSKPMVHATYAKEIRAFLESPVGKVKGSDQ